MHVLVHPSIYVAIVLSDYVSVSQAVVIPAGIVTNFDVLLGADWNTALQTRTLIPRSLTCAA